MGLNYSVQPKKQLRVIIDTDAACEADDPFAIVHGLLSKKLDVKAIFAEHFNSPDSTKKSYDEIVTTLQLMEIDIPAFMGEPGKYSELQSNTISPASEFLITEANKTDERPLFVLCLGAITNIATAIKKCPEITEKMTVVWIGGHNLENSNPDHIEFNSGNDIDAINIVISSGVEFWQIPNNVYGSMHIGIAEIQKRISPCGKIGKHLFENLVDYNLSEYADWTAGESWSLGDSPAIGVALEPNCGNYVYCEAPIFNADTSYRFEQGRPLIRVYKSINSRFIIEDLISKLELVYG